MSRAAAVPPWLALLVYGLALLQPALPLRAWAPPATEVKCACGESCGCWIVGHGDASTGTATQCHLYSTCSCGCCDGGPSQHHLGGREVPPHLGVALPCPTCIATAAVATFWGMPTPYSVRVGAPDKIPI